MNCFGRTPNNKSRLRLKSFFKRLIKTKVISSNLDCVTPKQEVLRGSGKYYYSSGHGDFYYKLEEVTENRTKKTDSKWFNKPQLPGKLILINNKYFRIC